MKICFVALGIYPCLKAESGIARIGGAELQQIFIGRGLQQRGISVFYLTTDHGQPEHEIIDGMTICKSYREEAGILGLRFFYPRLIRIWQALKAADADVYYSRTAGFLPGLLTLFCKVYRKKFIQAGAADGDFIPGKELIRLSRDRLLYRFGLRRASAVIVQSNHQNKLLWENYRIKGTLIRNLFEGEAKPLPQSERQIILWVSTIRPIKRPLLFIELARSFPDEKFVMIGGPDHSNQALFDEVKMQCDRLSNIEFLGFQPLETTETYFDRTRIFVNTSEIEGFPNTFLQAWRRGIPAISYVDPDGIIQKHSLGFSVESEQQMKDALSKLLASREEYHSSITSYFSDNHSGCVIDKYCSLLKGLVNAA